MVGPEAGGLNLACKPAGQTRLARVAETAPAIELRGLRREFGERVAFAGVDLSLPSGATLAVLGPNGSGKTTLLRVLAGLLRPSAGEARVLGCELPGESWKLRGRIGYLGHDPLLYRDLTPRENLRFVARLHGLDREDAESRIDRLLAAVGMDRRADDRVAEFSAGMAQRVAVCGALLTEPELLLLDEPEAHLDAAAREAVEALLAEGGPTRVIVSHDRRLAGTAGNTVLELG
jgi:ABC-type multidrug transport system ATPase subunit